MIRCYELEWPNETVNRLAIVASSRMPYLEWARATSGDPSVVEAASEPFPSIYLVNEPNEFDPDRLIQKHFAMIFEEQLNSWHRDESIWPKWRTLAMFKEWFEAKVIDMVWDLGQGPIEADE
jgi:hypothetical protein